MFDLRIVYAVFEGACACVDFVCFLLIFDLLTSLSTSLAYLRSIGPMAVEAIKTNRSRNLLPYCEK